MPLNEQGQPVLNSLGHQIREHWEKYLPQKVARFQTEGRLHEALVEAQDRTTDYLVEARQQGIPYEQAWEAIREVYAFPPAESQPEAAEPE